MLLLDIHLPDESGLDVLKAVKASNPRLVVIIMTAYGVLEAVAMTKKVANSPATTILFQGESGSGKDLFAKAIHYHSTRSSKPFLAVNCAALPDNLVESELFGYEKGAFTDARQQKRGLLELADGGTLLLDEIGEMLLGLQAKLLRVLEEQSFKRVDRRPKSGANPSWLKRFGLEITSLRGPVRRPYG